MVHIKKNDIEIRSATLKDAPLLNAWWNDGAVMAHAGFPKGLGQSLEETRQQIAAYEGKLSQLCIIEIDGRPVGELSFGIGQNEAQTGFKICDSSQQNRGYGKKIIWMTFSYLFLDEALNSKMPIHRIFWDTNLNNKRAQHVYESLGATRLRVVENAFTDQVGLPQSAVEYEMTRETFLALQAKRQAT